MISAALARMARREPRRTRGEWTILPAPDATKTSMRNKCPVDPRAPLQVFPCPYPLSNGWDVWQRRRQSRPVRTIRFDLFPRLSESIPGERFLLLHRARTQSSEECVHGFRLRGGESL